MEPVVGLFRAVHTFKGMAAAMGYANLAELAHRTESVLDVLRSDPAAGREHIDLFFRIVDGLERGVETAVDGSDGSLDFSALLGELDEASFAAAPTGSWVLLYMALHKLAIVAITVYFLKFHNRFFIHLLCVLLIQ